MTTSWNQTITLASLSNVETIGVGGFGIVKLAEHKITRRKYAIKIMRHRYFTQREVNALDNEQSLLAALDHKYVVKTWNYFKSRKASYIIMDFYSGGTLLDYINGKPILYEMDLRRLIKQMVSGLLYLKDKGICHRDIKLENYVFDGVGGDLKLVDFGLAKKTVCRQYDKVGTPSYSAPQVALQNYDPFKADIWSLGVCLYCIVYGLRPFAVDAFSDLLQIPDPIDIYWPDCSYGLLVAVSIIQLCLCYDEDDRVDIMELSEHPWLQPLPAVTTWNRKRIEESTELKKIERRLSERTRSVNPPSVSRYNDQSHRLNAILSTRQNSRYLAKGNPFKGGHHRDHRNKENKELARKKHSYRAKGKLRENQFQTVGELKLFRMGSKKSKMDFFLMSPGSEEDVKDFLKDAFKRHFVLYTQHKDTFRCKKRYEYREVKWIVTVKYDFSAGQTGVKFVKNFGFESDYNLITQQTCELLCQLTLV